MCKSRQDVLVVGFLMILVGIASVGVMAPALYACLSCRSIGYCDPCHLNRQVLSDEDSASSAPIEKHEPAEVDGKANIFLPILTQNDPRYNDDTKEWEIILRWKNITVCFIRPDDTGQLPSGVYRPLHPEVHCSMIYWVNPPATPEDWWYHYNIMHNGYKMGWDNDEELVWFTDPNGEEIAPNPTYASRDKVTGYDRKGEHHSFSYDGSDRVTSSSEQIDATYVSRTYTKYTEDSGDLVRKRVTVETYNSDGSKRFATSIYAYYDSSEGDNSGKLRYVVSPEGVKRYLQDNSADDGIDPNDPGGACDLDDLTEVGITDLDDYASVIYEQYDDEDRVTLKSGSGCGACGTGGKVRFSYVANGSYSEETAGPTDWKTCRRTCYLDSSGVPLEKAATVEYLNGWDQVIYGLKQTVTKSDTTLSVASVWITHNVYDLDETDYGDEMPRLVEVRHPSACTSYTPGTSTGESINSYTFNWTTLPSTANTTAGRVDLFEYHSGADSTTNYTYDSVTYNGTAKAGDFKGKLKYVKVRKGTTDNNSIEYLVRKQTYVRTVISTDDGESIIYHPYATTVYPGYTTTDSGGVTTTSQYVFTKNGSNVTHQINRSAGVYPTVSGNEHGSGSATSTESVYRHDTANNLHYVQWTKDEGGSISYRELNTEGTLVKTIADVDTDNASDFSNKPDDFSNSNGLHLITTYTYDSRGRMETVTDPAGLKTKTAVMSSYDNDRDSGTTTRLVTLRTPYIDSANHYDYLPVSITVTDLDGRMLVSAAGTATTDEDGNLGNDWTLAWDEVDNTIDEQFAGTLTSRADYLYDDDDHNGSTDANNKGQLTEVRRYHDIPSSSDGVLGTNYHRTVYRYDSDTGRRTHTIQVTTGTTTATSVELVTKSEYDQLGRVTKTKMGVSEAGAGNDMSADYDEDPTLYRVSANYYDEVASSGSPPAIEPGSENQDVGDGYVTSTLRFDNSGDTDAVRTEYYYDDRGRLRGTATAGHNGSTWDEVGPFPVHDYDNQGRTEASATYDTEPTWSTVKTTNDYAGAATSSNRVTLTKTHYDPKGQVYKTAVHEIASNGNTTSNSMETKYWYDKAGRTVKVARPDPDTSDGDLDGAFTKTQYDGAGRTQAVVLCYDHSEVDTVYDDANSISNDDILRITWTEYEEYSSPVKNSNRVVATWVGTGLGAGAVNNNPNGGTGGDMVKVSKTWYDLDYDGQTDGDNRPYRTGTSRIEANLTSAPTPTTNTDYVTTKVDYDSAGRLQEVTQPAASGGGDGNYTQYTYDDLGRTETTETFNSSDTRLTKSANTYGTNGQSVNVTLRKVYEVASNGTVGDYLETTYDYDGYGRSRKVTQPSGAFTKKIYSNYGRLTGSYLCTDEGGTDDALNVTTDTVVEQTLYSYDHFGRVWMVHNYQRHDDTTGTGELDHSSGSAPKARVTYVVTWWDDLGRTEYVASYGDNGGTEITGDTYDFDGTEAGSDYSDAELETGTDDYILAKYEYDAYSRNHKVTDNGGTVTRTFYDDAGRQTHVVENYDNFSPASESTTSGDASDHSKDRVTKFVYNEADQATKRIALDASGDGTTTGSEDQETRYVYAAELTIETYHVVKDGTRLIAVIYPDSDDTVNATPDLYNGADSTYDRVELTYYADGAPKTRKDQRGTVHTYTYDDLGRLTEDEATTLGGDTDGTIRAIGRTYTDLGLKEKVTSYSDTAAATAVNEVKFVYNDLGMVTSEYQEHEGAVTDSTSLYVKYGYDDSVTSGAFDDGMRLSSFTYPATDNSTPEVRTGGSVSPRVLHYLYTESGGSAGMSDKLSRVTALASAATRGTSNANCYAVYTHLGRGTIVKEDFTEINYYLSYKNGAGSYGHLDRFGRVITQNWIDYLQASDRAWYRYAYDASGNREFRCDVFGWDEMYDYDGLNRLKEMDRGAFTGTYPNYTFSSTTYNEAWSLNQLGNWSEFKIDHDGDDNYTDADDLDQDRTHNDVNEITGITEQSSPQQMIWIDPANDLAGNMTTSALPGEEDYAHLLVYDAWNRLVEVIGDYNDGDGVQDEGEHTLAVYEYDGLNRRVKKHVDTWDRDYGAADGLVDVWRHFYYSRSWQVMEIRDALASEEHTENESPEDLPPLQQFVWSRQYIDSPVLRDKNTDGTTDDACDDNRLYFLTDANMNVTKAVQEYGGVFGIVVESYTYTPYGAVTASGTAQGTQPLFCGYWYDAETGMYHVRNRMYHPSYGRWVQRDPSGYNGSKNLYGYVTSNPQAFLDPMGLVKASLVYTRGVSSWHHELYDTVTGEYSESSGSKFEARWKADITLENDQVVHKGGERYFLGMPQADAKFRILKRGKWVKSGGKDRFNKGGPTEIWKRLGVSVLGGKDKVLGPRGTDGRCVQCWGWKGSIEVEMEERAITDEEVLVSQLVAIGVDVMPGAELIENLLSASSVIMNYAANKTKIEWIDDVLFEQIICADGKRMVALWGIPQKVTKTWSPWYATIVHKTTYEGKVTSGPGGESGVVSSSGKKILNWIKWDRSSN